jgi:class 3 adenylate cyclase/predicted ATPase
MTFDEALDQVREMLQRRGRVTYRSLKLRYQLDDDLLAGITNELIKAERVAAEEDGDVLVWIGAAPVASSPLSVASSSQSPALQTPNPELRTAHPPAGERRQLTVMFIDLVGSTTLSQQLDPEDYHARVRAYQAACHQIIARYEGHIAQYLGDGVLVYFGYPTAHEEDAVRAVRSGLEIVTTVSQLAYAPPLQVRIGIHTGPVVVGKIGAGEHTERLALGDTPNLAARVQGQAEPDTVVISQATYGLVHGFFRCEALGPQRLKNVAAPLDLYRVQGEGEAHTRFEVSVQKGLTPLVGREAELGVRRRRWEQAKAGAGQVVLLSGEPGIGKSRLVQELKEHVSAQGATRIEFRCSPYHQNTALYPITEHLQRLLQFQSEDTPHAKLAKLTWLLSQYRFPQAETLPLLAALFSLPPPADVPPLSFSPQKQRQLTLEALVAWLLEEAERAVVYCAWEDLHWADPSTLEILTLFLDQVATTRILTLLTFRPEFTPPWGNRSHLSQLTLSRLGRQHVEAMVERVTGGKPLPAEVVHQIVAKTDGVPLFVEELTKAVVESGVVREEDGRYVGAHSSAPIPSLAIPATLQDSLMARLDRLAPVKEIAQLGATIGREFSYEILQAISLLDEATLQHGLQQLVEAELVYQHGLLPRARYSFKHALIQDTAYQSLLKSRRQHLHQQIARVLTERFPETVETQPELVAHHYTEAGLAEQAIPYWQKAGQRASQRSANVEAVSHLTTGLELLKSLPDTAERSQQELHLQIALGAVLIATKGYASLEARQAYARARELCEQMRDTPQLFPVLFGLYTAYLVSSEHKTAHGLAEQMLRLAHRQQAATFLLPAHIAFGAVSVFLGESTVARGHLEQGITLYDPQKHNPQVFGGAQDLGVNCLSYAAWALWFLGYPDQALKRSQEALTLARGLAHPYSLAFALGMAARFYQFRRDGQTAHGQAKAAITLCTDQGFPFFLAIGTILQGWALAEQGQREEGIAQIHRGIASVRATGAELATPYYLALLAEMYGRDGQVEEGLTVVGEALAIADKNEEHFYDAELYRLKGELTLQQFQVSGSRFQVENGPASKAEACFLKAIEIARRQQAKSLELRAVMSLSRLWQRQGKREEAQQMLAEVYGWFTEGFDTKDLQEAKTLLEELSH